MTTFIETACSPGLSVGLDGLSIHVIYYFWSTDGGLNYTYFQRSDLILYSIVRLINASYIKPSGNAECLSMFMFNLCIHYFIVQENEPHMKHDERKKVRHKGTQYTQCMHRN